MGNFKNYYAVLAIENYANADVVRLAYRQLARQYHPDLNGGDTVAEEKFKAINEAYDVLSSVDKRKTYDESLKVVAHKFPNPHRSRKTTEPSPKKQTQTKANTSKKEVPPSKTQSKQVQEPEVMKEVFEDQLHQKPYPGSEGASTARKAKTQGYRRGEDITVNAAITPLEAQQGVVKTVNVQHNELCRRCSATGRLNGIVCTSCHGQKVLARLKKIDVRIPPGVKEGSRVRVAAEGGRGSGGAGNGDLFLLIHIAFEQSLRVEGQTVYSEMTISVIDAVLGTEVDVPTIYGTVKMSIPPLTSSGKILRLKEQGVREAGQAGDHLVTVTIRAPQALSAQEKALYQELAKLQRKPAQ